jgi:hypothetical protein
MFNFLYNICKVNIYSSFLKQKDKIFLAKNLKSNRFYFWLFIKTYNSGNLLNFIQEIQFDDMFLIKILKIFIIILLLFLLFSII